jgi:hypothetical protein
MSNSHRDSVLFVVSENTNRRCDFFVKTNLLTSFRKIAGGTWSLGEQYWMAIRLEPSSTPQRQTTEISNFCHWRALLFVYFTVFGIKTIREVKWIIYSNAFFENSRSRILPNVYERVFFEEDKVFGRRGEYCIITMHLPPQHFSVKQFCTVNKISVLGHSVYSPDFDLCDFCKISETKP